MLAVDVERDDPRAQCAVRLHRIELSGFALEVAIRRIDVVQVAARRVGADVRDTEVAHRVPLGVERVQLDQVVPTDVRQQTSASVMPNPVCYPRNRTSYP